jgi:hypothetical protein
MFFHETYPPAKQRRCAFLQHFKALALLSFSSTTSKTLSLLSFLHNSSLQEDSCTHSLRQFFKYFQVFEPLRLCALPATTVLQQFRSGCNSETSLGLRTPCTAPVLNLHFCENENNVIPPELAETNSDFCQRTPCGQFHCTPCRKTLAQTEKQLKLILYSPSLQISDINMKSYIHGIKKMYNRKSKTIMSITFNHAYTESI